MVRNLLTEEFDNKTEKGVVLIDFYADWCGPCKRLSPTLESVAKRIGAEANIYKVDVDENADLANRFGIRGVPTMLLFKDGKLVRSMPGVQDENIIFEAVKSAL